MYYPKYRNQQDNVTFNHWPITKHSSIWNHITKRDCSSSNLSKHSTLRIKQQSKRNPYTWYSNTDVPDNQCLTKIIKVTANELSYVIKPEAFLQKKQRDSRWEPLQVNTLFFMSGECGLPHQLCSGQGICMQTGPNMLYIQISKTKLHSRA